MHIAVICPGCNERVLLSNFQLSFEHCDDCEVAASIAMQLEEDIEMAAHYGEDE